MEMQHGDVNKTFADVNDLVKDVGYKPNTSIKQKVLKILLSIIIKN